MGPHGLTHENRNRFNFWSRLPPPASHPTEDGINRRKIFRIGCKLEPANLHLLYKFSQCFYFLLCLQIRFYGSTTLFWINNSNDFQKQSWYLWNKIVRFWIVQRDFCVVADIFEPFWTVQRYFLFCVYEWFWTVRNNLKIVVLYHHVGYVLCMVLPLAGWEKICFLARGVKDGWGTAPWSQKIESKIMHPHGNMFASTFHAETTHDLSQFP